MSSSETGAAKSICGNGHDVEYFCAECNRLFCAACGFRFHLAETSQLKRHKVEKLIAQKTMRESSGFDILRLV